MVIIGQETIADMLGVAPKTVVEWQAQGLPVKKRGGPGIPSEYDSAAVVEWLIRRELAHAKSERPRDRLLRAQAEMAEIGLREKRGELVSAVEIMRLLTAHVIAVREFLRGQPARLAFDLGGLSMSERQAKLAETFDGFLQQLAKIEIERS